MGFNPPVPQQDNNWGIRVAVLLSLLLQVFLIFLGPTRRRSSSSLTRIAVWSCYLLADWVADLALGLILNNMGNIGGGGGNSTSSSFGLKAGATAGNSTTDSSSPIIFAFWTPFLLLHLGGPDTITAYSLEDNELWFRHLIGFLFELFSASVIFICSLRGNPMIHATVLMFVAGIIKCSERNYSLLLGSLENFRANIIGPAEPGRNYARLMTEFDSREKAGLVVEITLANSREAKEMRKDEERAEFLGMVASTDKSIEARAYDFFGIFRRLFVDLILSSKQRRMSQAFFLEREDVSADKAFDIVELELSFIYDMVYTKAPVAHSRTGWLLRSICFGCLVSTLVIFLLLDEPRHNISRVDTGITYALLLGGLALDAAALLMLLFSNRVKVFLEKSKRFGWLARLTKAATRWRTRRWSRTISQFNLINYCVCYVHPDLGRSWFRAAENLDIEATLINLFIQVTPLRRSSSGEGTLEMFFGRVKEAALQLRDKDDLAIEEAFNCRGSRALNEYETEIKATAGDKKFHEILDSVARIKDFDESLLLWHVATDLCLFEDKQRAATETEARLRPIGDTLSEYMLYLLIKQPEMLPAGLGLLRYRDTCAEAQRFFASMDEWIGSHEDGWIMLLKVNTSQKPSMVKGDRSKSVLFDAVILAKALRELDEDLMWEVVAGVWVKMLLYAARKCPGSTHVRQLNRGGELITVIWLLMEHMVLGNAMHETNMGGAIARLIVHDH